MQKLFKWLDDNILFILSCILLIFIPLYPKKPILDILPGYIVRIRLEDILVGITWLIWVFWLLRKKISVVDNPLFKPISAYLIVGILSMLSAAFVTHSVPLESLHVNKMILHFLRRLEYFSLFFIFYSSVRSFRQVKIFLGLLILCITGVVIYGFGQKYLYWPAFSTMNREFSKGWALYLTEHARVLSTFGGHYDLAAFIMMSLVILWSLFFTLRSLFIRFALFVLLAGTFWVLILTASRTSFIAYLVGLTLMFFFWAYKKGIAWSIPRWTGVILLSLIVMFSFGDLSERFTKILRIQERLGGVKSVLFSPIGKPPQDKALFLENNPNAILSQITSKSDQPPSLRRPSDVYQDIPLLIPEATDSSIIRVVNRTYSPNAFRYDLSTAIRFDALWPMAINGFRKNPILGTGYSTLNKTQETQFTEAESTDNDYLRSLGETGILGFITFFGTLLYIIYLIWRNINSVKDPVFLGLIFGVAGFLVGLMVNAIYIDVFESSKVAFSFWAITGFSLAGLKLVKIPKTNQMDVPRIPDIKEYFDKIINKINKFIRSDTFLLLLILTLAFSLRLYKIKNPIADWHSWRQADTSAVTRNYVKNGVNLLYPTYDDLSNVASGKDNPKGYRFVEFPLYNYFSVVTDKIFIGYGIETAGRLTNIFASFGSIIFIFLLARKYLGRKEAVLAGLFYAILPYNIFYTRVILPEPFMVFTSLGMIYFFDRFIEEKSKISGQESQKAKVKEGIKLLVVLVLAIVFTAFSILIKPFAAFLFLPMIYLWFRKFGFHYRTAFGLLGYWIIGLLPFILWRLWMNNFPQGIPAFTWLLNGDNIRFKGAFFYWIFADRIARLILGYWGLPLLVLGILAKLKKEGWFFYWWAVAVLLYLSVVATGNVRHDYYQIITIPIITIFLAKGVVFLIDFCQTVSKIKIGIILGITIIFMEMFGWYHIRDFYNVNHPEIVEAGQAVDRLTKRKGLVIAPYNGDTAFLYQTQRAGWPIIEDSIEKTIGLGAHYYVSVNFDEVTRRLIDDATLIEPEKRQYKLIELTDKYVLIQLVSDKQIPD